MLCSGWVEAAGRHHAKAACGCFAAVVSVHREHEVDGRRLDKETIAGQHRPAPVRAQQRADIDDRNPSTSCIARVRRDPNPGKAARRPS